MPKNAYLCIEMSGKGSISRMSDECLMKQETVVSFYIVYQAVMRKFTLANQAFEKVATSITKDLWLDNQYAIYGCIYYVHCIL